MERIVTIYVPYDQAREVKPSFDDGDYPTMIGVTADVNYVLSFLRDQKLIGGENKLIVNLQGDKNVNSGSLERKVDVLTVYSEADNGMGQIDTVPDSYIVDIGSDINPN